MITELYGMEEKYVDKSKVYLQEIPKKQAKNCLLYTSDAADE